MSAQRSYTYVTIDGDGACGYSAQALVWALFILKHSEQEANGRMDSLLDCINEYYNIQMNYNQLRDFLNLMTTRYDIQQFLAPVVYKRHQEVRPVNEHPDLARHPASITNNTAIMGDITVVDQALHMDTAFYGRSREGHEIAPPQGSEPDFVYRVNGYHYDLSVKAQAYGHQFAHLLGNTGRYGPESQFREGYFYTHGITSYAVENPEHSRLRVSNLIRQHLQIDPVPVPEPLPHPQMALVASRVTDLPPMYRDEEVLDINRRTNQLLDRVFNARISDDIARDITRGLNAISDAHTHQDRLGIIQTLESRLLAPPARTSTVFRPQAQRGASRGLESGGPEWLAIQAS